MKKYRYILVSLLIIFSSCSDSFLNRESMNDLSNSTFWKNEKDALMGLMGCYDALQSKWLYNSDPWAGGFYNLECISDNGYIGWSWMAGGDIARGQHTPQDWMVGDFWKASYKAIVRCNNLIHFVPKIESIPQQEREAMVAEAKVIRALMYLNLTMTYRDVPFIQEIQSISDSQTPKTSKTEIIDALMIELADAADKLDKDSPKGRINKGAAWGILARMALYNEKWSEAVKACDNIIALNKYNLYDDYDRLFSPVGENSDEVIFAVQFERGISEGSSFAAHWGEPAAWILPTNDLANDYYCTDGLPISESPLYIEGPEDIANNVYDKLRYENRDPRLKCTILTPYDTWRDAPYQNVNYSATRLFARKYFQVNDRINDSWDSEQDAYVVRYADILLMKAEALLMAGNYQAGAVTSLVNEVRQRTSVNMPKVEDVEAKKGAFTKDVLLNIVKHERRVELAWEGLRYFDLLRWRELKTKYDQFSASGGEAEKYALDKRKFRDPQDWVWPLPQFDIDANKNLVQAPEWGGK